MAENNVLKDMKTSIFWAGAIDNLPDPVRSTRWRMIVPASIFGLLGVAPTNGDDFSLDTANKEFALHVSKGPNIPEAKHEDAKISYMGFEKYYPTKQSQLASTFTISCLLLEDMRAYETMLAWNQACLNTGIMAKNGDHIVKDSSHSRMYQDSTTNKLALGLGQQENVGNQWHGLLRNTAVRMELYDWNYGDLIMSIGYVNAWPQAVKVDTQFGYDNAQLGSFSVTFRYDRWNIYIPKGYKELGPEQ